MNIESQLNWIIIFMINNFFIYVNNSCLKVLKEGVDETAGYESPNTLQMSSDRRHSWFKSRAFISLMVATHKGHLGLVKMLLQRSKLVFK